MIFIDPSSRCYDCAAAVTATAATAVTAAEAAAANITHLTSSPRCQIEWPTKDFLAKQFPAISWTLVSSNIFASQWIAHTMSFEKVLAEWEEGIFTAIAPALPLPFSGLFQAIGWSRERGEAKQAELVGMTSVLEVNIAEITSRFANAAATSAVAVGKSFETEE
jgi:hypothetical protein